MESYRTQIMLMTFAHYLLIRTNICILVQKIHVIIIYNKYFLMIFGN